VVNVNPISKVLVIALLVFAGIVIISGIVVIVIKLLPQIPPLTR
jgi:hypothetical protein